MADENLLWPVLKANSDVAWRVEGVLQKGFPDTLLVLDSQYCTVEMKDVGYGSPLGLLPEQIAWCRKAGRAKAPHFVLWIFREPNPEINPRVCILSARFLHAHFADERHFTRTLADDTSLPANIDRWHADRQGNPLIGCTLGRLKKGSQHFGLQLRRSILCRA